MKSVRIQSFFGPYFPVFGLNMGKYGPEKTVNTGIFHAVFVASFHIVYMVLPDMKLYIYIRPDMNSGRFDIHYLLNENSFFFKRNTVFKRPKKV